MGLSAHDIITHNVSIRNCVKGRFISLRHGPLSASGGANGEGPVMAPLTWLRGLPGPVLAGVLAVLGSAVPVSASASGHPSPSAVVVEVSASPGSLPASGGTVAVTGSVKHATSCQLQLLSHEPFPVIYSHNPTSGCEGGDYAADVTIGANTGSAKRLVAFTLIARNASSSFAAKFYVVLAGAPSAVVVSASASPSSLPPQGGEVTVVGVVKHARSCQLQLLSKQSFPVIYASNLRPCVSGFRAHVIIGANTGPAERLVAFSLVARNTSSSADDQLIPQGLDHLFPQPVRPRLCASDGPLSSETGEDLVAAAP